MSVKTVVARQYRDNVNIARAKLAGIEQPSEGWLRTVRKALGMSGAQLARRMGITRGAISNNERAEIEGAISLKTIQQMAAAMNCRFVYAVIPEQNVENVMAQRAHEKAKQLVRQASVHMALEDQVISAERLNEEVAGIVKELLDKPSNLWDEV